MMRERRRMMRHGRRRDAIGVTAMTQLERELRAARRARTATGSILAEYTLVLVVILLVGAVALAEASGLLDTLVHSISFLV
jgi:hypothetical protein